MIESDVAVVVLPCNFAALSFRYVAATEQICATLSDLAKLHVPEESSKRIFRNLQKKTVTQQQQEKLECDFLEHRNGQFNANNSRRHTQNRQPKSTRERICKNLKNLQKLKLSFFSYLFLV